MKFGTLAVLASAAALSLGSADAGRRHHGSGGSYGSCGSDGCYGSGGSYGSAGSYGSGGSYGSTGSYGSGGSYGSSGGYSSYGSSGGVSKHDLRKARRAARKASHGSGGSYGSSGTYGSSGGVYSAGSYGSAGQYGSTGATYSAGYGSTGYGYGSTGLPTTYPSYGYGAAYTGGSVAKPSALPKLPALPKPASDDRARIVFNLPVDADLYLVGTKMDLDGENRRFVSPELKAGKTYSYPIRVVWTDADGVERVVTGTQKVRRGSRVVLNVAAGSGGLSLTQADGQTGALPLIVNADAGGDRIASRG